MNDPISKSISTVAKIKKRSKLIDDFEVDKVRGRSYHLNDSDKMILFDDLQQQNNKARHFENSYSPTQNTEFDR